MTLPAQSPIPKPSDQLARKLQRQKEEEERLRKEREEHSLLTAESAEISELKPVEFRVSGFSKGCRWKLKQHVSLNSLVYLGFQASALGL